MRVDEQAPGLEMADIRASYAPEPHADGAKETRCQGCGEMFWQWERQYRVRCQLCAAGRSAESIRSMRNKEGEYYERWLLKQWAQVSSELARLGLTPGT